MVKVSLVNFFLVVLLFTSSIAFSQVNKENVISKKLILKAKKALVWSALTSESELSKWWNKGVKLKPYIGGEFYEPWGDNQLATGKVQSVKNENYIEFTWKEKYFKESESTLCKFSLKEINGSTTLIIMHSGWETFGDVKNRRKLIKGFNIGWGSLLSKLKNYIETESL